MDQRLARAHQAHHFVTQGFANKGSVDPKQVEAAVLEAEALYIEVLGEDENDPEAAVGLASLYLLLNKPIVARRLLEPLEHLNELSIFNNLAAAYRQDRGGR